MDSQIVDKIEAIATKAMLADRSILKPPGEPPHVYYLRSPEGEWEKRVVTPPLQAGLQRSVDSFAAWVKDRTQGDAAAVEVWYDRNGLEAFVRASGETTRFDLLTSPQVLWLEAMPAAGQQVDQKTLYRLLRTTFRDSLRSHPGLLAQVGKIDFKRVQESAAEITRTGVSMGKKMTAEAKGADAFPEVLSFVAPFFTDPKLQRMVSVRAVFELDADAERFTLYPYPGDLDAAVASAEDFVATQLAEALKAVGAVGAEVVPCFHGDRTGA